MVTTCLFQEYVSWFCDQVSKEEEKIHVGNKKGRERGERGKRCWYSLQICHKQEAERRRGW